MGQGPGLWGRGEGVEGVQWGQGEEHQNERGVLGSAEAERMEGNEGELMEGGGIC